MQIRKHARVYGRCAVPTGRPQQVDGVLPHKQTRVLSRWRVLYPTRRHHYATGLESNVRRDIGVGFWGKLTILYMHTQIDGCFNNLRKCQAIYPSPWYPKSGCWHTLTATDYFQNNDAARNSLVARNTSACDRKSKIIVLRVDLWDRSDPDIVIGCRFNMAAAFCTIIIREGPTEPRRCRWVSWCWRPGGMNGICGGGVQKRWSQTYQVVRWEGASWWDGNEAAESPVGCASSSLSGIQRRPSAWGTVLLLSQTPALPLQH